MFPTPVGMNRQRLMFFCVFCDVPHTRGDEPAVLDQLVV